MTRKKTLAQVRRRPASRAPALRIVLICEGEKTEKIYFTFFVADLRAINVRLEIPPRECGTDPQSVVDFAISVFLDDPQIDICFCIIDRDTHANFDAAIAKSLDFEGKVKGDRRFKTIPSHPSFEYWFLSHFVRTTKPYVRVGKKSPAEALIADLKRYLPTYEKNSIVPIRSLLEKTDKAIENSQATFDQALQSGSMNPSTEVHVVIKLIQKLTKSAASGNADN